jgi:hypothetical protein
MLEYYGILPLETPRLKAALIFASLFIIYFS